MTNKVAAKYWRERFLSRLPTLTPAHTDTAHYYIYNGVKYPSVSAPLTFFKKAELYSWALKQQRDYVLENWKQFDSLSIFQHIAQMENKADSIRDEAARIGTMVHQARENMVQWYWKEGRWPTLDTIKISSISDKPEYVNGLRCWLDFVHKESYEPVLCETMLVDDKLGVAGSMDDVGFIGDKLVLVDVKTSNNVDHYTYWLQVSKYWSMFRKHVGWKKELKPWLLHLPKKPGQQYKLTEINEPRKYARQYDELFKIWQSKDNYKPEGKEKIII